MVDTFLTKTYFSGKSSDARSVRNATFLRLQLRRLPAALAVHAAGGPPHAQDLPRQLVPEGRTGKYIATFAAHL